jgi:hypothetical protein
MRLYLESTIFNYYFDKEREGHVDTVRLFEEIRVGKHEAFTSDYTILELEDAPEPKRSMMLDLIDEFNIAELGITDEINRIADLYITRKIIPGRFRLDGAHIAAASINEMDCILSYNFQHINRLKTKVLTEQVNREEGYKGIVICTAKEVLDDEQQDE